MKCRHRCPYCGTEFEHKMKNGRKCRKDWWEFCKIHKYIDKESKYWDELDRRLEKYIN